MVPESEYPTLALYDLDTVAAAQASDKLGSRHGNRTVTLGYSDVLGCDVGGRHTRPARHAHSAASVARQRSLGKHRHS